MFNMHPYRLTTTANDGCTIAFQSSLPIPPTAEHADASSTGSRYDRCIVLMHGFSGSSEYFKRNFDALAAKCWVVAPDMRGHGASGRTTGGHHVARLAADLRQLLRHLTAGTRAIRSRHPGTAGKRPLRFVPVGCSIGAAVLWTYAELFGHGTHDDDDFDTSSALEVDQNSRGTFAGYIFVDQAPLQDRVPKLLGYATEHVDSTINQKLGDIVWAEDKAHNGCYDESSMRGAQQAWVFNTAEAHVGLVSECLGYRFAPDDINKMSAEEQASDEAFFTSQSARCDSVWLARLLADHTRYDHRDAIEEVVSQKPVFVMAGGKSGCFPLEGMKETERLVNKRQPGGAEFSLFENDGHWLFWENPNRFHAEVLAFTDKVTSV